MKTKIKSFIMTTVTILIISILGILGILIYNEITKSNIVGEVQDFVSNITISSGEIDGNIKNQEIIKDTKETLLYNEEDINVVEGNKVEKYFYNQLDEYSKIIYKEIEKNKDNMKTGVYQINLGTGFSSLLSQDNGEKALGDCYQSAIEAFSYDNPDVFYIEFSKLYLNIETTTKGNKKTYKVFINSGENENYLTSGLTSQKIKEELNEIEKIKLYFTNNKKSNTYENIKMVHDYLVDSIEYDQTISQANIYDIYGALINKKSVCEGYAKAFKYLMDSINIPCVTVSGKGTNSEGNTENHAWNYVRINGMWYAVDCTWDDPILIGSGYLSNSLKYKYFLKGEDEFNKSHTPNGQFTENGRIFEYPNLSKENY